MALKSALFAALAALDDLTAEGDPVAALLGPRVEPFLYSHSAPARIPEACKRYVVFSTSEKPIATTLANAGPLIRATVAFGVYGRLSEADRVEQIVDILRAYFKALRNGGTLPLRRPRDADDTDVPDLNVRRAAPGTPEDDVIPAGDGSDVPWLVTTLDVEIDFVDPVEPLS